MLVGPLDYRYLVRQRLDPESPLYLKLTMRAFAKAMGISPSFLTEIMNRSKSLSLEMALRIATKMDLSRADQNLFSTLVQIELEKDEHVRALLVRNYHQFTDLTETHLISPEEYKQISDWYHYAILELTFLDGIDFSPENLSRILHIESSKVELALQHLLKLNLLTRDENGRYEKTNSRVMVKSDESFAFMREHHRQILEKSITALELFNAKKRVSATDILTFDFEDIGKVDELSIAFSKSVMALSENARKRDAVYSLAVQFFPLATQ